MGLTNIPPQTQATEDRGSPFFPQSLPSVSIHAMDSPGEFGVTTTKNVNIIPCNTTDLEGLTDIQEHRRKLCCFLNSGATVTG